MRINSTSLLRTGGILILIWFLVSLYFLYQHVVTIYSYEPSKKIVVNGIEFDIQKLVIRNFERKTDIPRDKYLNSRYWWSYLHECPYDMVAIPYAVIANFYSFPKVFQKKGYVIAIEGLIAATPGSSIQTFKQSLKEVKIFINGYPGRIEIIPRSYEDYVLFTCEGKHVPQSRVKDPVTIKIKHDGDTKNIKFIPEWTKCTYYSYGLFDFSKEPDKSLIDLLSGMYHG